MLTGSHGDWALRAAAGIPRARKAASCARRTREAAAPRGILGILALGLIAFGAWGGYSGQPTLGWALGAVAGSLLVRRAARWRSTVELVELWLAGFLYLYSLEWLSQEEIVAAFGLSITARAEAYTIAALGATLAGYWWKTRGTRPFDRQQAKTAGERESARRQRGVEIYGLVLGGVTFAGLLSLIGVNALVAEGRTARYEMAGQPMLMTFVGLGIVATPVVLGFLLARPGMPMASQIIAAWGIALSIVTLTVSGTRFPLGFAVSALLYYTVLRREKLSTKALAALLLVGVLVAGAQALMMASRSIGLKSFVSETRTWGIGSGEEFAPQAEGLLRVTAVTLLAQPSLETRPGLEHAFLAYWWVPRSLWPNKPTMAGHYLMREYDTSRGYGEGHSFSGGFAFAPLIDFGPLLGVGFMTLYGVLIGVGERALSKARQRPGEPRDVFLAPLLFGVFFAIRSPFTSLILLQGLWMISALPVWLLWRTTGGPTLAGGRWRPSLLQRTRHYGAER